MAGQARASPWGSHKGGQLQARCWGGLGPNPSASLGMNSVEGRCGRTLTLYRILPAQAAGQGARTRLEEPNAVEGCIVGPVEGCILSPTEGCILSSAEGRCGRTLSLHRILPAQAAGQGARTRPEGPEWRRRTLWEDPPRRPFDFGLVDLSRDRPAWHPSIPITPRMHRRPLAPWPACLHPERSAGGPCGLQGRSACTWDAGTGGQAGCWRA